MRVARFPYPEPSPVGIESRGTSVAAFHRMQTVIAQFKSESEATSALRQLEAQGFSIQNMVITDERRRFWRKFPRLDGEEGRFVVYSLDDHDASAAARAELRRMMYDRAD